MKKNTSFAVLIGCVALFFITNIVLVASGRITLTSNGFGVIVAAGLTLAMYSFLYKDTPIFKIAENLYVGVSLGYTIIITWYNFLKPDLFDPLIVPLFSSNADVSPKYSLIIPLILGGLILTRLSKSFSWLSRWSFAYIVGLGAGIGIPRIISSFIIKQVEPSLKPLFVSGEPFLATVNTILILVGVISVLFYFFFSVEHTGTRARISQIGVWFLMVSFGASFGYTVMGRMSLLIGRMQFLLKDWLGVLQ
ncbi:MAG: hypothetical protein ACUZ8O_17250 [Candidatus Anammoxibacter sp.]